MDHQKKAGKLISQDLLPVLDSKRNISALDLFFIWAAIAINIGGFAMAFSLYPAYSPLSILGIIFLGYLICVILIVFVGDIGITYGITYSVFIRASFGYLGAHIPGLVRVVSCLFWAGFQTYLAAMALNAIVSIFVPGYNNFWLMVILFTIVQVLNASFGVKAMAKFDGPAVVFLLIVLAVLLAKILEINDASIFAIMSQAADTATVRPSLWIAISGAAGGWIAIPVTFMDISRTMRRDKNFATQSFWDRNKKVLGATLIGITVISPLMMLCGLISGVLTGTWNPIEFAQVAFSHQPFVLIICFLAILFAQWSTNTAANMLPAANILVNISPRFIKFPIAMVIVGVLSIAIRPWQYLNDLYYMLAILSALIGPLLGIMLCDYYILRRRKLNVPELFKRGGQYAYYGNLNPAGLIALVVACVIGIAVAGIDLALYVGIPIAMALYYLLMKVWILKRFPQAEMAEGYQPNYYYEGEDLGFAPTESISREATTIVEGGN